MRLIRTRGWWWTAVNPLRLRVGHVAVVRPEYRNVLTERWWHVHGWHRPWHSGVATEVERVSHEWGRSVRIERRWEHGWTAREMRGRAERGVVIIGVLRWGPRVHAPGSSESLECIRVISSRTGREWVPASTGATAESATGF